MRIITEMASEKPDHMMNENDTTLYACYLMKEEHLTKKCVMKEIKKNDYTVNKQLWYRTNEKKDLKYNDICEGQIIEVNIGKN
jgi:hypothetical protein